MVKKIGVVASFCFESVLPALKQPVGGTIGMWRIPPEVLFKRYPVLVFLWCSIFLDCPLLSPNGSPKDTPTLALHHPPALSHLRGMGRVKGGIGSRLPVQGGKGKRLAGIGWLEREADFSQPVALCGEIGRGA